MDIEKMFTSQQVMKKFGLSVGMITHYARMFGVQKYAKSYMWTPEQVEQVAQRVGKIGNPNLGHSKVLRICKECPNCKEEPKSKVCTLADRKIDNRTKCSPRWCPLGSAIKKTN